MLSGERVALRTIARDDIATLAAWEQTYDTWPETNWSQLEVLASNAAAIRAYEKAGFVEEGRLRESAWVRGAFVDEVYMSVLRTDSDR